MKFSTLFLGVFLFLGSASINLFALAPNEVKEYVKLGEISRIGMLELANDDSVIGNRYVLDSGNVLLDRIGGGISLSWAKKDPLFDESKYLGYQVITGGLWDSGESLFISVDADLKPNKKIMIYNPARDEERLMTIIK